MKIVQTLSKFTKTSKIYFINHDNNLDTFKENCERKLTCILCKNNKATVRTKYTGRYIKYCGVCAAVAIEWGFMEAYEFEAIK